MLKTITEWIRSLNGIRAGDQAAFAQIRDAEAVAIMVEDASALIEANTVVGPEVGIEVENGAEVTVRGEICEDTPPE